MTTYAIIVTYNGAKWIDKCFGSLVNSSIPLHILAIDNASTDGTPDIIRRKYPQVEVIDTGQNLGFGKANNLGLKRVLDEDADYAFLLNQDAWVENDTVNRLIETHQKHPAFAILSPVPYDGEGLKYDYLYSLYYQDGIIKDHEYYNKTYEIDFINAAAWLIPKETLINVGAFHPRFKMYGEDKNYIDRVKYLKTKKIGITKSCKYYHDRKSRNAGEISLEQLIFNIKINLMTKYLNPRNITTKVLFETLRYNAIVLIKKQQPFKLTCISTIYAFFFLPIGFTNKKLHIAP